MEHKRKCISCGEIKTRAELIKITKEHNTGSIIVQPDAKTFGRSAYVCKNSECINLLFKKNKLYKILRINSENTKEEVLKQIEELKFEQTEKD